MIASDMKEVGRKIAAITISSTSCGIVSATSVIARMSTSALPPRVAAIAPKVMAMSVEKSAARIAVVMMSWPP